MASASAKSEISWRKAAIVAGTKAAKAAENRRISEISKASKASNNIEIAKSYQWRRNGGISRNQHRQTAKENESAKIKKRWQRGGGSRGVAASSAAAAAGVAA
jgi:uncharacterized protein YxjI